MPYMTWAARRPRAMAGVALGLAGVVIALVLVTTHSPATASAGSPIPAAAIPHLTKASLHFAKINGDRKPTSLRAVATTRSKGVAFATPGDRIPNSRHETVYVVLMKGTFTYNGPAPPGFRAPKESFLTVVFNSKSFEVKDFGLRSKRPSIALNALGPVTVLGN